MNYRKYHFTFSIILIALFIGLLALVAPTPAQAGAGLPPRDLPTSPGGDGKDNGGPVVGAYIELAVPDVPSGAWAAVQWQDSAGGWHNVEGWQGSIANSRRWWVHPKDFGHEPFRWVVFAPGGAVESLSPVFNLSGQPNETLRVEAAPSS